MLSKVRVGQAFGAAFRRDDRADDFERARLPLGFDKDCFWDEVVFVRVEAGVVFLATGDSDLLL